MLVNGSAGALETEGSAGDMQRCCSGGALMMPQGHPIHLQCNTYVPVSWAGTLRCFNGVNSVATRGLLSVDLV